MISYRYADCNDDGRTEVRCPMCGGKTVMTLDPDKFRAWATDTLIQVAFPDLSTEQRETLITGLCDACQAKIYGDDDD